MSNNIYRITCNKLYSSLNRFDLTCFLNIEIIDDSENGLNLIINDKLVDDTGMFQEEIYAAVDILNAINT